ncbi:sodium:calcium antiporter [Jannaschia sp. S6380]|uniref:sodium:calcium antiporter n=1 Tax=Jannaschia sp. S6380 TaxID=2926408 RepID=UPI001FF60F16|nr:sodium:calcium antiporter [Jannaschia sp. S6380]MCK0167199.1 sodium:calcium antiporter [Jannaschia sp. S6380]
MIADLSNPALFGAFAVAAGLILGAGMRMAGLADRLADRTGLGEALVGAVLLGAATSLSGTVVSFTSALDGRASLAFSNAVGGIAAQTAFLALADLLHRRANLEHAAAELANVFQGALLVLLLTLPVLAFAGPEVTFLGLHPVSFALPVLYIWGLRATRTVREFPMWKPVQTAGTRSDDPEQDDDPSRSTAAIAAEFAGLMALMGAAGWIVAQAGGQMTDRLGLSASLVGALLTAVATSLPELVTTLAAVRRRALQLAVGGIVGGNTFDTLFLAISDAGYRDGSLYHAVSSQDLFWLGIGLVMTVILLMGQILRQKDGPAGIGLESVALLTVYGGAIVVQILI